MIRSLHEKNRREVFTLAEIDIREINRGIKNDAIGVIKAAEVGYYNSLGNIANEIIRRGDKVVLLAGPSGSGKTTSANIIKDLLEAKGHTTVVLSLDNFYRERFDPMYPLDENGEQDYESVHALRTDEIRACITAMLEGKSFCVPTYDFKTGLATYDEEPLELGDGAVVILEGLHALNPIIADGFDSGAVLKVFISVSTNINDGAKRLISGRKMRFIRRMTRDSIYRGTGAADTLKRWQSVLDGEDEFLYPFRHTADIDINTFHFYELGAMKQFALEAIKRSSGELCGEYIETVKNALDAVLGVDESLIPETSLLREFIPGGKYEHLY